ncbi:MAG: phage portal protein [candidate division WOR-3 bacterium]
MRINGVVGNLFSKLFARKEERQQPGFPFLFSPFAQIAQTGFSVSPETLLTIPAVYACVNLISGTIASMPLYCYKKNKDGNVEIADNIETDIISNSVHPNYTPFSWRRATLFHVLITGNSYSLINRDANGNLKNLQLLAPHKVVPFLYNGDVKYEVYISNDGISEKRQIFSAYDILHFCGLSEDGIVGKSPITALRESAGLYLSNIQYTASVHKNGGRLRGYLKHPDKLTAEQVQAIRENFVRAYDGGFPLLENGVTFEKVALTPADLDFINTARLTIEEIARLYSVPLHMVGIMTQATFSNMEQQSLDFLRNTLLPWIKMIEAELNKKLLTPIQRRHLFFRHNFDGILRADYETRMKGYQIAIQNGIMSPDEVRALENMNPIPNDAGNVYFMPVNTVVLGQQPAKPNAVNPEIVNSAESEQ